MIPLDVMYAAVAIPRLIASNNARLAPHITPSATGASVTCCEFPWHPGCGHMKNRHPCRLNPRHLDRTLGKDRPSHNLACPTTALDPAAAA